MENIFGVPEEEQQQSPGQTLNSLFAERATPADMERLEGAKSMLQNVGQENAMALFVAGAQLIGGSNFGDAAQAGIGTKLSLRNDRLDRAERRQTRNLQERRLNQNAALQQRQLEISEGQLGVSRANAMTAMQNARRAAAKANDPLSAAGKAFQDYQTVLATQGEDAAKDFLQFTQKSGLGLDFNEDGSLKAVRFGRGAQNTPLDNLTTGTKTDLEKEKDRLSKSESILKGLEKSIDSSSPQDFGLLGSTREQAAGFLSQLGMDDFSDAIRPGDVQTQLRLAKTMFAQTFINEPRVTDADVDRIDALLQIAVASGSKPRAKEAVGDIREILKEIDQRPLPNLSGGTQESPKEMTLNDMFRNSFGPN